MSKRTIRIGRLRIKIVRYPSGNFDVIVRWHY